MCTTLCEPACREQPETPGAAGDEVSESRSALVGTRRRGRVCQAWSEDHGERLRHFGLGE